MHAAFQRIHVGTDVGVDFFKYPASSADDARRPESVIRRLFGCDLAQTEEQQEQTNPVL